MTTRSGSGTGFRRRPGRPRYYSRRKVCSFCVGHVKHVDYKEVAALRRYLTDRYKIEARRKTGVCTKHQRHLATAVKRARHLAMIPFSPHHRWSGAGMAV